MARIRSIKPEFWEDRKLAMGCSRDARLLYIGLWNLADEHGRLRGDPRYIQGKVFPYDDVDVPTLLGELEALGRVRPYEVDGEAYLYLPKLADHQRLDKRLNSRLPEPPAQTQVQRKSTSTRADKSTRDINQSGEVDASAHARARASQVAGGREQVAGTRSAARQPRGTDTPDTLTETQRSKKITDAYAEAEPMCKWPAVNGVVLKAIRSGKFTDDEIEAALLRLAKEGRSVTVETLRIELNGLPTAHQSKSPGITSSHYSEEEYSSGF